MATPTTPGDMIREARTARGWTQGELADRLGWCRETVWRLEHGRRQVRLEIVMDLATVLGWSGAETDQLLRAIVAQEVDREE